MRTLRHICALLAIGIGPLIADSELKFSSEAAGSDTGTMWYQKSVTFTLEGYKPLIIEEDVGRNVFPTGAKEIQKLGPARFLVMGGYSAGGGTYTTVVMIIAGQDTRLVIEDQLEFTRDRRNYQDKIFKNGGSFAVGFPSLPLNDENAHDLGSWHFQHKGKRYDLETLRKWPLQKVDGADGEMIVFRIGNSGFLLPEAKEN